MGKEEVDKTAEGGGSFSSFLSFPFLHSPSLPFPSSQCLDLPRFPSSIFYADPLPANLRGETAMVMGMRMGSWNSDDARLTLM